MTSTNKTTLKTYFNTGDIPTEAQFHAWIDTTERSFHPEDFGAVGDGVTDDTLAIQAALDAAANEEGGVVRLTKNYAISDHGSQYLSQYGPVHYAIIVNHNNVFIKGPGTLTLPALPAGVTMFTTILFTGMPVTQTAYPVNNGPWLDNVGVDGVVFDNSALTYDQRSAIGGAGHCANIEFSHVRYFHCTNNTIIKGWGTAPIYTGLACAFGTIKNNRVRGSASQCMWLDGLRYCEISGNVMTGRWGDYPTDLEYRLISGIAVTANGDNSTGSEYLHIHHNTIISCNDALSLHANDCQIDHNTFIALEGVQSNITINYGDNGGVLYMSSRTRIENNTIVVPNNGISAGRALYIYGAIDSPNSHQEANQDNLIVTGNRINHYAAPDNKGYGTTIELGEHVHNSWVINNFIDGETVTEDATCSGNTITPNY